MTWKVTVGGGILVFLIGSTFWAGAAYNRIDGIERQLVDISVRLSKISDISVMQVRIEDLQDRINRLEQERNQ